MRAEDLALPHFDGELLAWALRELRARRGLTQAQVAEAAGLNRSAVAHLESNRRRAFIDQLAGLARALAVTPALLLAASCREAELLRPGLPCVVILAPDHPVALWGQVASVDWPAGVAIYRVTTEVQPRKRPPFTVEVPGRYVRGVR